MNHCLWSHKNFMSLKLTQTKTYHASLSQDMKYEHECVHVCLWYEGEGGWGCVGVEPLTAAVQISLLVPTHRNLTIRHHTPLDLGESHLSPQPPLLLSLLLPLPCLMNTPPVSPQLSVFWSTLSSSLLEVSPCEIAITFIPPLALIFCPPVYLWFASLSSAPSHTLSLHILIFTFLRKYLSMMQSNSLFLKCLLTSCMRVWSSVLAI